jgi:hypothetical protein
MGGVAATVGNIKIQAPNKSQNSKGKQNPSRSPSGRILQDESLYKRETILFSLTSIACSPFASPSFAKREKGRFCFTLTLPSPIKGEGLEKRTG